MKKQRRKPPRRPQKNEKLDGEAQDLAVLTSLLLEHRVDTTAKGWLTLPWRSGWNAIGLAVEVARYERYGYVDNAWHAANEWMTELLKTRSHPEFAYVTADEFLGQLGHRDSAAMRAAVRCLQMMIARSDGGGHNYNHVLQQISGSLTEGQILLWRGYDALGILATTTVDHEVERRRTAFNIAWRRGLFHAAYAIKPITVRAP